MLCIMLISVPATSFAKSTAKRIGENVLSSVLSTILADALKNVGKDSDSLPIPEYNDDEVPAREAKIKSGAKNSGVVTELSDEQFQSFSEICLVGSIEEFRKKIEYENISAEAAYTKNDGSIMTLMELAQTSPNPELAEFLQNINATSEGE